MQFRDDTIAAISTPAGKGGIGIVRISGPAAVKSADAVFRPKKDISLSSAPSHCMFYGHIMDPAEPAVIDEVLTVLMRAPHSYTCEDVVEISCHGGMVSVRKILEIILSQGVRLAEPGEFTKRAFLNGRLNLTQAEAVIDIINAKTEAGIKIASEQLRGSISDRLSTIRDRLMDICAFVEAYIDFPEDEIETASLEDLLKRLSGAIDAIQKLSATFEEGRFFREGLAVAIVGKPNVGKSSLLNTLTGKDRAIVTDLPGTTRDLIEDYLNLNGLPVRIMDTAGIRSSDELIEQEGIRRSLQAIEHADFVIAMFDGSSPLTRDDLDLARTISGKNNLFVISKSDLPQKLRTEDIQPGCRQQVNISAVTGEGIEELKKTIFDMNIHGSRDEQEGVVITNMRHKTALDNAASALKTAAALLGRNEPLELFSIEMKSALDRIGEITGTVTTDEILDRIFSSFCIGK